MPKSQWTDKWKEVRNLQSGSQGIAKCVIKNDQSDSVHYFLKTLRRQDDIERRKRIHKEAQAYRALDHSGIPKLIDSNTDFFADRSHELYLVTEMIDGCNLAELIERGPQSFENSLALFNQLIEIAIYCHEQDFVHRDIKPDNIMLRNCDPRFPVLIDFGITFNMEPNEQFETHASQEVGNRFLRLPELGIQSANKRDCRSDITSICGILFYCLTGDMPVTLLNEDSLMPHQRASSKNKLSRMEGYDFIYPLFDKGFQININHRWSSGKELAAFVSANLHFDTRRSNYQRKSSDILDEISLLMKNSSLTSSVSIRGQVNKLFELIRAVLDQVIKSVNGAVHMFQTGFDIQLNNNSAKNTYGFKRIDGRGEVSFNFTILIAGSELILTVQIRGETSEIARTDATNSVFDEISTETLLQISANEMRRLLLL